jgi:hypothetical protein
MPLKGQGKWNRTVTLSSLVLCVTRMFCGAWRHSEWLTLLKKNVHLALQLTGCPTWHQTYPHALSTRTHNQISLHSVLYH